MGTARLCFIGAWMVDTSATILLDGITLVYSTKVVGNDVFDLRIHI